MRRALRPMAVLVLSFVVALTTAPAEAGEWAAPDPSLDSDLLFQRPPDAPYDSIQAGTGTSEADIHRVLVRHTPDRVVLSMRVTGLTSRWRTTGTFPVVTPRGEF